VPSNGAQLGQEVQFSIPQFGDFFGDMCLHIVLSAPTVTHTVTTVINADYARWIDLVGHKLCSAVSFSVNGNDLDAYDSNVYNMYRQFKVSPGKRVAWDRCVGQEVQRSGFVDQDPNGATLPVGPPAGPPYYQSWRQAATIADGAQTPKFTPDGLELFMPLLFWFNLDPRLAIPSVSIPYGQRFIKILLAPFAQLFTTISRGTDAPTVTASTVTTCELYINNLFVNPEIHDIFIKRIGFNLIRVYRQQMTPTSTVNQLLMSNLKWPIETLYIGFQPAVNVIPVTGLVVDDPRVTSWCRYTTVTNTQYQDSASAAAALNALTVPTFGSTVETLTVTAHGVTLYNNFPSRFYNAYLPLTYGGENIVAPEDPGLLMVTFNLYPGSYQPSGHINLSRAREFYLSFTSAYISAGNTVNVTVVATAINFLLVADGGAVLRYTT
jgi:hypothetical protein